ncbi:MAG: alpha/beta hydrolase, partial [Prevotellaceae bacterium]|nr:alpha/beta hydrolase [Prevotellaceae bacterium]
MKIKETFKGMKILGIAMLMLISVYSTLISGNNRQPSIIQGEWKGLLKVQGMELNLIFDIKSVDDSLKAAFYSIDQTPNPIPVSSIKFENGTLEVEMPIIKASFQGKLTDNVIVGTFTQGMNFPLELRKMKEKELSLELRKVKERESKDKDNSLLYNSIEVKFENKEAGITLAGTLTIPKEGTNFAAVALVTGSGAQNRDETIMQHKPFKRIANYLSSKGFAVLRYDDRGVAESKGNFAASTTLDFLSDALAAVKFLKSYPNIDNSQIGIIGHSEGGAIS